MTKRHLRAVGDDEPDLLARVQFALDELHRVGLWVGQLLERTTNLDDRLELLAEVIDAVRELQIVADEIDATIRDVVPYGPYPVPGGGVYRVSGGRERKRYDNERLVSAWARKILEVTGIERIVTTDGEVGEAAPAIEGIARTLAQATGATAPSFDGWRSTVAKAFGIHLNDYAELDTTPLKGRIEGRPR